MLLGGSVTLLAISLQSLVQMAIDDHFRGRVMGLWTTVSIGSGALGAVIMGVLIDRIGVAPAQATIGLVLTGLSAVIILRFRQRG
jgi:MFS family permease